MRSFPRSSITAFARHRTRVRVFASFASSNAQARVRAFSTVAAWRALALDRRRSWSRDRDDAPCVNDVFQNDNESSLIERARARDSANGEMRCAASCARVVLATSDPRMKAELSHVAYEKLRSKAIAIASNGNLNVIEMPNKPGRPQKPRLVSPRDVPTPKQSPVGKIAHVVHTLAHIELNAIDLAWDTVGRFAHLHGALPDQFFLDFAHVADDESRHLSWCLQRLNELGVEYGDVDAHDLLWQGAEATFEDPLARLAVVPCTQEARGLDAGPRLVERLVGYGDNRSAAIVRRISDEEVGHVAVGAAWFRTVCFALDGELTSESEEIDLDAREAVAARRFRSYVRRVAPDALRGPFNVDDRARAGIPPAWYSDDISSPSVDVETSIWDIDADACRALRSRLADVVARERAFAE